MHLGPADSARRERPARVRIEAVFAGGEGLVLSHLPTASLSGVPSSRLPDVGGDHLAQLLLALVTHHGGDLGGESAGREQVGGKF